MTRAVKISLFIMLLLCSTACFGQKEKYYSVFIYNFTKYIEWPNDLGKGKMVITVIGDKALYNELMNLARAKSTPSQTFEVHQAKTPDEVPPSQIVVLGFRENKQFEDLKDKLGQSSTLLVTDQEGMGHKGSMINFVHRDGKIKFELNEASVAQTGLKVSSSLKALAITI